MNVRFDVGLENDFKILVTSSQFLITTSITEGFGFSFLEPWLANKLLWGRKLPDICIDFEKNNIRLEHLYTRLLIPIEWIGKKSLADKQISALLENCRLYNFSVDKDLIKDGMEKIIEYIENERGKHFDPVLVDILIENIDKFQIIREELKDVFDG